MRGFQTSQNVSGIDSSPLLPTPRWYGRGTPPEGNSAPGTGAPRDELERIVDGLRAANVEMNAALNLPALIDGFRNRLAELIFSAVGNSAATCGKRPIWSLAAERK